jgi:SSS family solute:Na+ symporter
MTLPFLLGSLALLALVLGVAFFSGRQVKSAADFSSAGGRASLSMVIGALTGTMVGGASTIGTAQLAFTYGHSAWWFTVGGGLGMVLMGLYYAVPMRRSGYATLAQAVANEYGAKAGLTLSLLNMLGTFISVIAQVLSGATLLSAVSDLPPLAATTLMAALMLVYVVYGGALGAGYVGIIKVLAICLTMLVAALVALQQGGGLAGVLLNPALPPETYRTPFARGFLKDAGAGLAAVFGFISTQANITSMVSAKNDRTAVRGGILTGLLMPFVGAAGILVGLYMRTHYPDMPSSMALPQFILNEMPGFLSGAMIMALLVTIVGSGAGLSLGISNIIANDIMPRRLTERMSERKKLRVNRGILTAFLLVCALLTLLNIGGMILNLTFLSMGLRGAAGIGVLTTSLRYRGKIGAGYAMASMVLGVVTTIVSHLLFADRWDPSLPGVLVAGITLLIGAKAGRKATL